MFTGRAGARRGRLPGVAVVPMAALIALTAAACGTGSSPAGGTSPTTARSAPATGSPASPSPPREPLLPAPAPVPGAPGAPEQTACKGWPRVPGSAVPLSFVPVAVLRCVTGYTSVPGKGEWLTATMEKADQNLMPLVRALRAAPGRMRPGMICPQFATLPPQIVLVGANGTMIRPRFPVTNCGQIQQQVFAALDGLRWHTVSQRLIEKVPPTASA